MAQLPHNCKEGSGMFRRFHQQVLEHEKAQPRRRLVKSCLLFHHPSQGDLERSERTAMKCQPLCVQQFAVCHAPSPCNWERRCTDRTTNMQYRWAFEKAPVVWAGHGKACLSITAIDATMTCSCIVFSEREDSTAWKPTFQYVGTYD